MSLIPETDTETLESLRAIAVAEGHPEASVRTLSMRVYEVPQEVYDVVFPPPVTPPARGAQSHKKPRKADQSVTTKEASHGDEE